MSIQKCGSKSECYNMKNMDSAIWVVQSVYRENCEIKSCEYLQKWKKSNKSEMAKKNKEFITGNGV